MKQFQIKNFLLVCGSSGKTNVKCNNENLMKRLLGTHTNSWEILQLKKDVNIAKSKDYPRKKICNRNIKVRCSK